MLSETTGEGESVCLDPYGDQQQVPGGDEGKHVTVLPQNIL